MFVLSYQAVVSPLVLHIQRHGDRAAIRVLAGLREQLAVELVHLSTQTQNYRQPLSMILDASYLACCQAWQPYQGEARHQIKGKIPTHCTCYTSLYGWRELEKWSWMSRERKKWNCRINGTPGQQRASLTAQVCQELGFWHPNPIPQRGNSYSLILIYIHVALHVCTTETDLLKGESLQSWKNGKEEKKWG